MQGVRKLTTKILQVLPSTKNKMKMSNDKVPFDASVSSKTVLNLKRKRDNVALLVTVYKSGISMPEKWKVCPYALFPL
jgi:hypothetical protein